MKTDKQVLAEARLQLVLTLDLIKLSKELEDLE